jgi:hypothetical protein
MGEEGSMKRMGTYHVLPAGKVLPYSYTKNHLKKVIKILIKI